MKANEAFYAAPPLCDLRKKLGPVHAKDTSQVSPGALLTSSSFLTHMMSHGCANGVLEPKKAAYSLRKFLHAPDHMEFLADWGMEVAISTTVMHWQQCCGMLRHLKR